MRWIGDTPIIEMTDYTIPTVGKFSVRLLFYRDRYLGTWQHENGGRHVRDDQEELLTGSHSPGTSAEKVGHVHEHFGPEGSDDVDRRCPGVFLVAYAAVAPRAQNRNAGKVTDPKEQFGWDIGDYYRLVNYTQYEQYLKKLD